MDNSLFELIANQGTSAVIVVLFLTTYIEDRKYKRKQDAQLMEVLAQNTKAIETVNKSLELLKQTNDNTVSKLTIHDERSIEIKDLLTEIRAIIMSLPKRK